MMVTARACGLLLLAGAAVVVGLFRQDPVVLILAVACLIWLGLLWLCFRLRADFYLPTAQVSRSLSDNRGHEQRVLWAGRTTRTAVELHFKRRWWLPGVWADVQDILPTAAEQTGGESRRHFWLGGEKRATLDYSLRPRGVGELHFSGVRLQLADAYGMFYAERFLPLAAGFRVLPLAAEIGSPVTVRKHNNALPPPGIHAVSRAGVGSELLEIRDYVPGDSPRSIAWKISARRDALMCKQYESEVPVRCRLLVDMSPSVRLGYPGPCAGTQLVSLAATLAHTLASHRDPVAISSFDGQTLRLATATASRKSVLRMVDQLCGRLAEPLPMVDAPAAPLLRPALDVARVRYPDLLLHAQRNLRCWFWRGWQYRARLRLAAVLVHHFGLPPTSIGQLLVDDRALSLRLQQFLAAHHAPYLGACHDTAGRYLFDSPAKVQQLTTLLSRAVARGRDNELYVILAELTDADYDMSGLTDAIKVARARHHRVMVVCAWPPGAKPTKASNEAKAAERDAGDAAPQQRPFSPNHLLTEWHDRQDRLEALRRQLGRWRVPVVAASDQQATQLVLSQLELLRSGRSVAR